MTVVPLGQMNQRMPEAGRIRLGVKTGNAMKSIDTFRLTSPYKDTIEKAAEVFGAKVGPRPWSDAKATIKDQWEVITAATAMHVYLPPGALSCHYELWSGGGRVRQCDGEMCDAVIGRGDNATIGQVPCMCEQNQRMECKPTSRLNVLLPDLPFRGVWRLESHGWNALHELSGMESMIAELQTRIGVIEAELSVQSRSKMSNGKKSNFVVPVLTLTASAKELVTGQAAVGALGVAPEAMGEIGTGEQPTDEPTMTPAAAVPAWDEDPDEDIVEAEIVEVEAEPTSELHGEALHLAADLARQHGGVDPAMVLVAFSKAGNRAGKAEFTTLTPTQQGWVVSMMQKVLGKKVRWTNHESLVDPAEFAEVRV